MQKLILLLAVFAVTVHPVKAQLDIQNLTPQQQKGFESKLKQKGIEVDYNKLSAEEKERYYQYIKQGEQKQQPADPRLQSGQIPKANNHYRYTLTPLTDFGNRTYQGVQGGLYPNGENVRPQAHTDAGVLIANSIKPLDRNGKVDEKNGKIVWVSIGMSNTTQETQRFLELMQNYPDKNPKLELVDGAFGRHAINEINDTDAPYWNDIAKQRLEPKGLSPEQVQIVWFKLAEITPSDTTFVTYTHALKEKYLSAMQILKQKFPNAKIAYLSSRIYGGYSTGLLNPEPFAWYTGWANKLLIEDQINGDPRLAYKGNEAKIPWLSWGPYLWSNGETPNSQGISWFRTDIDGGGTHPNATGRQKVAEALIKFFSTDETSVPWFLKR